LTEEERQKDISSLPAPNILGEEHKGAIFKGGKRRIAVIGSLPLHFSLLHLLLSLALTCSDV